MLQRLQLTILLFCVHFIFSFFLQILFDFNECSYRDVPFITALFIPHLRYRKRRQKKMESIVIAATACPIQFYSNWKWSFIDIHLFFSALGWFFFLMISPVVIFFLILLVVGRVRLWVQVYVCVHPLFNKFGSVVRTFTFVVHPLRVVSSLASHCSFWLLRTRIYSTKVCQHLDRRTIKWIRYSLFAWLSPCLSSYFL